MQQFANAPCSWGVYYPDSSALDPETYLRAIVGAGYRLTELGPFGYLPSEAGQLKAKLATHGLALVGAAHVHTLADGTSWRELDAALDQIGTLLQQMGCPHFVLMDESEFYPSETPGLATDTQWDNAVAMINHARRVLADRYDLILHFHPHVGTCIETEAQIDRLLAESEVSICFDTGHHAFWNQDVPAYMEKIWDRIGYVHLKNVDAAVRRRVLDGTLGVNESFEHGVMCPLDSGDVDIASVIGLLRIRGFQGPMVVEQDPSTDAVLDAGSLAQRNLEFLSALAHGRAQ